MPILTLTTDWGLRDHYVASFKGELMSRSNDVKIVDISHQVEHFDILQASFVIKNCFAKFPEGTLHFIGLAGVQPASKNERRNYLILKSKGHFFIGEDNGIFSLILGDEEKEMYGLSVTEHPSLLELHTMFIEAIVAFLNGKKLEEIGSRVTSHVQ